MTTPFLVAAVLFPFFAELFVVRMVPDNQTAPSKNIGFYLLTPLKGSMVYITFLLAVGHPYLALGGSALYYFGLTAISNKKYEVLKEPFNAHDFDNVHNLYINPEFYVSYVGWPVLVFISLAFIGVVGGSIYLEDAIALYELGPWYYVWPGSLAGWFAFLWLLRNVSSLFFNENSAAKYGLSLDLKTDVTRFGLFPTIFLYRLLLKAKTDKKALRERPVKINSTPEKYADIIAVQGESYFDLGRLFQNIDGAGDWNSLRTLEERGVATGQIEVPAWGAYTMQTEFSFLSSLPNHMLGVDRINPYMRFALQPVATFVSALQAKGYKTLCIHPAKKEFFRRSNVMLNLGFDDFIDVEAFEGAAKYGKYISDSALADKIEDVIASHRKTSEQPLFIFAITIESHGPWAKGRIKAHLPAGTSEEALTASNPTRDPAFALYQQHMENLLDFYRRLSIDAPKESRERVVAMYGDHMPALGSLFTRHGFTDKPVDYLLYKSGGTAVTNKGTQQIEGFAETLLAEAGLQFQSE